MYLSGTATYRLKLSPTNQVQELLIKANSDSDWANDLMTEDLLLELEFS